MKEFYKHEEGDAKYGEGQGKTALPSNCLLQSSTLLAALHAICSGITMFSVCKQFIAKKLAEAYVDNANCMYVNQNNQQNETPTMIRDNMKKVAQTWINLVFGLVGKLLHDKTYWWQIW
eukprot:14327938-Ditylum_brightwellii.AAC.1